MKCMECGHELRETREPITEIYKGEEFTVGGIRHFVCRKCGNIELDGDDANAFSSELVKAYALRHRLLSPERIKAIRESLGMTQGQFGAALGVSAQTCCRWERGTASQSETADKLLRLVEDVPAARAWITSNSIQPADFTATVLPFTPAGPVRVAAPKLVDAEIVEA